MSATTMAASASTIPATTPSPATMPAATRKASASPFPAATSLQTIHSATTTMTASTSGLPAFVYSPYQNTVENNTVNGKPLVYLEDVSDYKVEDAGQVIIVNCNNITVENIDLSNTSVGIELWRTENSKVLNNTVSNNSGNGIILSHSCNNTITGNNVNNNVDGIYL
jgi:parallel beta-helix repeat protein